MHNMVTLFMVQVQFVLVTDVHGSI